MSAPTTKPTLVPRPPSLMDDAVSEFGAGFVSQYLLDEGFSNIEEALDCHEGDEQSLWAALTEARDEYVWAHSALGVGA